MTPTIIVGLIIGAICAGIGCWVGLCMYRERKRRWVARRTDEVLRYMLKPMHDRKTAEHRELDRRGW